MAGLEGLDGSGVQQQLLRLRAGEILMQLAGTSWFWRLLLGSEQSLEFRWESKPRIRVTGGRRELCAGKLSTGTVQVAVIRRVCLFLLLLLQLLFSRFLQI
jgi:hypothetical protein